MKVTRSEIMYCFNKLPDVEDISDDHIVILMKPTTSKGHYIPQLISEKQETLHTLRFIKDWRGNGSNKWKVWTLEIGG